MHIDEERKRRALAGHCPACGSDHPERVGGDRDDCLHDFHNVVDEDEAARIEARRRAIAAAEERGRQQMIAALREHYLFHVECDSEQGRDKPWCGCSAVDLGWHPSVGEAVAAWIRHLEYVAKEMSGE